MKVKKGIFTRIRHTCFEGNNYVGKFTSCINSEIGNGSYIGDNSSLINTKIGNYCSIGSNVKIIFGSHPTQTFVSTHPAFYSARNCTNIKFVDYINNI